MTKNDDSFDYLIKNHTDILLRIKKLKQETTCRMSASNSKFIFTQLRIKADALDAAEIILNTLY
ncbi:MAG TPA: hypothetical protein DCG73_05690 [Morganella sp. (in: Bacteria)]|nr:hypothetical protein [Morganella sp. (in: enterobacteria)]